jgi:hypothetical protein
MHYAPKTEQAARLSTFFAGLNQAPRPSSVSSRFGNASFKAC